MYAVVSTGGKQVKVTKDETVAVEKLDAAVGETVTLPVMLVVDGDNVVSDAAALGSAQVTAEVVGHGKADKVIIFKFKKRKGYKRTRGHRQPLTLLRITDVALSAPAPKRTRKKAEKPAEETAPAAVATETPAEEAAE